MNPEWLLVLAPVLGLGAFLVALSWPVEDEDGGHGLGVPDREIRPQRGVPEDTETVQETEEEQAMSQNDEFARNVALEKAMALTERNRVSNPAEVIRVAEMFRAFLAGKDAKPNPVDLAAGPEEPKVEAANWIYFRYRASKNIYYRSDINKPSTELGNLQRKGRPDHKWSYIIGLTRAELRERNDEYIFVPRSHVPTEYLR